MTKEALEKTKEQKQWGSIFDDLNNGEPLSSLGPLAKRRTLIRRVDMIARQNRYDEPSISPKKYAEYIAIREVVRRSC